MSSRQRIKAMDRTGWGLLSLSGYGAPSVVGTEANEHSPCNLVACVAGQKSEKTRQSSQQSDRDET